MFMLYCTTMCMIQQLATQRYMLPTAAHGLRQLFLLYRYDVILIDQIYTTIRDRI